MKLSHILYEAGSRMPIHWTFKSAKAYDKFYEYQTRNDMIDGQHVEGTHDKYQFPGLTSLAHIEGERANEELFNDDEGNVYAHETGGEPVAISIGLKTSDMLTFFD